MATSSSGRVLEKVDRKTVLDDTIPIKATIVTQRAMQSHHEFVIRVQRGPNKEDHWDVNHRYSNFDGLNTTLQSFGYKFQLPPKTMFRNTTRDFLAERQSGLQIFLDSVMKDPRLMLSLPVRRFLDPANYSENFHDNALRSVSMFFRSNPDWCIVEPLKDIGWRIRKHYYLISSKGNTRAPKKLLSHIEAGPDFCVDEKDLEVLLKLLVDLKHPNILSPSQATLYSSAGLCIARDFYLSGSLRDKIYKVPSFDRAKGVSYLSRYCTPLASGGIDYHDMRRYGRHVLDGMKYLLDRGFVLGHVHCGNVILVDDVCRLTDLENCLMGIPPYYRQYVVELRKIQGQEAEAVYAFGHLLYEMSCGMPLTTPTMDDTPPIRNDVIVNLLQSLLSKNGMKTLPTISELLANDFFKDVSGAVGLEKPFLKVPIRYKEVVKTIREKYDTRLRDNQQNVAKIRRLSKVLDSVMSTEKKKERRRKIKKEMSLQDTETGEISETGDYKYPKTKMKRQSTISTSQPSSSSSNTSSISTSQPSSSSSNTSSISSDTNKSAKTDTTTTKKKLSTGTTPTAPPPPPATQPPEPRPNPPAAKSTERGALLGSIESFAKGKLKKAKTNDRSVPKL